MLSEVSANASAHDAENLKAATTESARSRLHVFPGDLDGLDCDLASFLAFKPISDQDGGEIQHHGVGDSLLTLVEIKDGGHNLLAPFRSSQAAKPTKWQERT